MAVYRNVLVVAPDAGLPDVEAEVRALSDALRPVTLRNGVTVRDVTERITRQSWDIIWFACHGTNGKSLPGVWQGVLRGGKGQTGEARAILFA